jgi:polyisoprenoid-binding protein YceI
MMQSMKKALFTVAAVSATTFLTPAFAADRYEFDKSHTRILFYINHMGFSDMVGEFTDYDGSFTFDPEKPQDSTIDVTLKPSGIRTSSSKLDEHLQGDQFFKTSEFPTIRFVSTKINVTDKNNGEAIGNVTMLGVTKPVTLKVHLNKADYRPMGKDFVAGFSASATLKRSDFGMKEYIPMIGDEVRLEVQTEIVDIDHKKQEAAKGK